MNYAGHHILTSGTVPNATSSPLSVGYLWSDTSTNAVKVCTSVSPVTFASISSGASTPTGTGYIHVTNGVQDATAVALPNDRCVAYNSAVQAVGSGAFTTLSLDSEDTDSAAMHDLVTNNSRITVPSTGFYFVMGHSRVAASTSTQTALQLVKNGTTTLQVNTLVVSSSFANDFEVIWCGPLTAGDYVELQAFQNSGGSVNFGATGNRSISSSLSVFQTA